MALNGIDISNWNYPINPVAVPGNFVIMRASEGQGMRDPHFAGYDARVLDSDRLPGAYHFMWVGSGGQIRNTAKAEAANFARAVENHLRPGFLLVADWEPAGNLSRQTGWAVDFAHEVKRLTGRTPLLYANLSTLSAGQWARWRSEISTDYWLAGGTAQYAQRTNGYQNRTRPPNPTGFGSPIMHQFTEHGYLPGWSGRLDLNEFYGDAGRWRQLADDGTVAAPVPGLLHLPGITADTLKKAAEVVAAVQAAGRSISRIWGYDPDSPPEHSSGRALDFMCDRATGDWIADYLWANRSRLRVKWIIWRQRIRSTSPGKPGTWEAMADRGSATANHMDHVHAFFDDGYTPPAGGGGGSVVVVPQVPVIREADPPVHFHHHHGGRVNRGNGQARLGCVCMQLTFPLIEKRMLELGLIRHQIDVFQGGYNRGGVAASAGTHDMGGVIDVLQGITRAQRGVWADFGVMMFPRIPQYGWRTGDHGHGVWHGCVHRTASAARQVASGMAGYDGLVGNARRNFVAPKRPWQDAYREYARETITIIEEEDEPVATAHLDKFTMAHPGGGPVLPGDAYKALHTTGRAVTGVARATLAAPDGIRLSTRWVSWSGRADPGWVREERLDYATSRVETTEIIDQGWGGADLQLDIWASEPCQIEVVLSSLTSPKR